MIVSCMFHLEFVVIVDVDVLYMPLRVKVFVLITLVAVVIDQVANDKVGCSRVSRMHGCFQRRNPFGSKAEERMSVFKSLGGNKLAADAYSLAFLSFFLSSIKE